MQIKHLVWTRGDVQLVLEVDRKALVPLLCQTALERIGVGGWPGSAAGSQWVTSPMASRASRLSRSQRSLPGATRAGSF